MAGETRRLEAAEINIGRLLTSGDFEFVIPEYQRPYAWGAEESLQLLSDLLGALERDTDEPYFLGSIVLVKSPNVARSEVIDGQQRITTLTLLLSLLRDLVANDDLRRSIHNLIEKPAVEWDNQPARPRLKLRPRDNQFFYDYVQTVGNTAKLIELSDNIPETDSQRGLRDNAKASRRVGAAQCRAVEGLVSAHRWTGFLGNGLDAGFEQCLPDLLGDECSGSTAFSAGHF